MEMVAKVPVPHDIQNIAHLVKFSDAYISEEKNRFGYRR